MVVIVSVLQASPHMIKWSAIHGSFSWNPLLQMTSLSWGCSWSCTVYRVAIGMEAWRWGGGGAWRHGGEVVGVHAWRNGSEWRHGGACSIVQQICTVTPPYTPTTSHAPLHANSHVMLCIAIITMHNTSHDQYGVGIIWSHYTNSGYVYKHPRMHHDKRTSLQTA